YGFQPAMNKMITSRSPVATVGLVAAFAVRQVAMTETQEAQAEGAARLTTPESADDAFSEVTEELTALRAIVEAASHSSGEEDFQALVRNLARVVDARYAFVAEFASPETQTKARTIAFW